MDKLEHKTLVTKPFDLTYSYYLSPAFHDTLKNRPEIPVLLFSHGYPDDACKCIVHLQRTVTLTRSRHVGRSRAALFETAISIHLDRHPWTRQVIQTNGSEPLSVQTAGRLVRSDLG